MRAARGGPGRPPALVRAIAGARSVAVCALSLLSACTLDITDVEPDPVSFRSSPPRLSVQIELDVDEPEAGLARIEIDGYFLAGVDEDGELLTAASVGPITVGSLTIDPEVDYIIGAVRWRAVETVPIEGDTLRFTPPVVDGFAQFPEMVVPVGVELDPMEDIELAPGGEIELAIRLPDGRVADRAPVQDDWLLTLGSDLYVSGRSVPPTIRLPGELVSGIELPADLRFRSSRLFRWDGDAYGGYPVQLMRSTALRLTVTPVGSGP